MRWAAPPAARGPARKSNLHKRCAPAHSVFTVPESYQARFLCSLVDPRSAPQAPFVPHGNQRRRYLALPVRPCRLVSDRFLWAGGPSSRNELLGRAMATLEAARRPESLLLAARDVESFLQHSCRRRGLWLDRARLSSSLGSWRSVVPSCASKTPNDSSYLLRGQHLSRSTLVLAFPRGLPSRLPRRTPIHPPFACYPARR